MINPTDLSISEQMANTNNLLNLVSSELFTTLDHSGRCLEMFILERQSYNSLQQFTHALHQVRGTLTLIEINGAAELAETMLQCAGNIPCGADSEWDNHLSLLSESVFILRHYLENFASYPILLSELLIPAINKLRKITNTTTLNDSFFSDIPTKCSELPFELASETDTNLFNRLRQMYQIGLLGLIKEENNDASLRMMNRAMNRLQFITNNQEAARLCWVTSNALTSFRNSQMTAYPSRKKLFSRVDQQLKKTQLNTQALDHLLLKDLLYIITLDNQFDTNLPVVKAFQLRPYPITNTVLEAEFNKLKGPSQNAICSFTSAIKEELNHTKTTIDRFSAQQENHPELVEELITNITKLIKTLSLVDLQQAEIMLREQIGILKIHQDDELIDQAILERLAEVILHVDSIIICFENSSCTQDKPIIKNTSAPSNAVNQYLLQGKSLAIQEALTGLATVQQAITAYIESNGDKQYIEKTLQSVDEIYGSLLFLNQERAANIIDGCRRYIEKEMILANTVPNSYQLDNLADILTSLEFYMETNISGAIDGKVLDLSEESLTALYMIDIPTIKQTADIPTIEDEIILPEGIEPPVLSEAFLAEDTKQKTAVMDSEPPVLQEAVPTLEMSEDNIFDNLTFSIAPLDTALNTGAESTIIDEIKHQVSQKNIAEKETNESIAVEEEQASGYKNWTLS